MEMTSDKFHCDVSVGFTHPFLRKSVSSSDMSDWITPKLVISFLHPECEEANLKLWLEAKIQVGLGQGKKRQFKHVT